jgi:hypothetical protein
MRLLDRILSESFITAKVNPDIAEITRRLESAQLVVIDNVADYHFQDLQRRLKADETMKISDFPNVMLPFEMTFLEMRVRNNPSFEATFEECGVLAFMTKREQIDMSELGPSLKRAKDIFGPKDVAYSLMCLFFAYGKRLGKKPVFSAVFMFPVTADGQIVPLDGKFPCVQTVYLPPNTPNLEETQKNLAFYMMETYLYPCFLALSFMHCRNVKVRIEQAPEKLSKKYQKRTGRPLLKYRVLQIDHMKQVLEREGHASTEGLKKALHICRGHFKHYGRDGKGLLFGKHVATVWIPMHTRGAIEEGVVVKDYDVK